MRDEGERPGPAPILAVSAGPAIHDRLDLFGAPRIWFAGEAVAKPLDWQKPVALLAFLACQPQWHSRESLAHLLRPDSSKTAGLSYIRGLLHRTRELLPGLVDLEIQDARVRWRGLSDVVRFERAIASSDWPSAVAVQLEPLLASVGSTGEPNLDEWFHEERLRLRQRLARALIGCIADEGHADADCRAKWMERLIDLDPLDESAVQMVLLNARSPVERHVAGAAYQDLCRRLAAEDGREPLGVTRELHGQLHARTASAAPSLDAAAPREPVGAPATSARSGSGRDRELREIAAMLADPDVRLVTIHGPGGSGKSYLARALFEDANFPAERKVWVDVAGIETLHGMFDAIVRQLNIAVQDGPVEAQVASWLARRDVALFLDNCEQLGPGRRVLDRLLQSCGGLRLIVTSREALDVGGEHLYPLDGLDCEGPGSPAVLLLQSTAARLGRKMAADEEADAAELVKFLDGLPLAIELAANWMTLLPVKAVLAELQKDPGFIDSAPSHTHRAARSVFAGVWGGLDRQEQAALLKLSVVPGRLASEALGAGDRANAGVYLRLVRKSLLRRQQDGSLRMHPLLRSFVQQQSGIDEVRAARRRHSLQLLEWLAAHPAAPSDRHVPGQLAAVQERLEEVAQAWRVAIEERDWNALEAALPNLVTCLLMASRHELLAELAGHARSRVPSDFGGVGQLAAAQVVASFRLGQMRESEAIALDALAQDVRPNAAKARIAAVVSCIRRFHGDLDEALVFARTAVNALDEADDLPVRLQVNEDLALCLWHGGQLGPAEECLLRNLTLATKHKVDAAKATSLCLLGVIRNGMGRAAEALDLLRSSEPMLLAMNDSFRLAFCRRAMSYAYLQMGDLRRQRETAQSALEMFRSAGFTHELAEATFAMALAHDAAGQASDAAAACREALRLADRAGQVPIVLRCIAAMGALQAPEDRERGLSLLLFAQGHPSLIRGDQRSIALRLAALHASERERAQLRTRAAQWTLRTACDHCLGFGANPAVEAFHAAFR